MGSELGELEFPRNGPPREQSRQDRAIPAEVGHGDIVDREEPCRLERDRPRVALDDHRVERQLLGAAGLITALGSPVNFEGPTVHPNRGAKAMKDEGMHMLM